MSWSFLAVLLLAVVHVAAGRAHRAGGARPRWMSAASGLSIAYVCVDLLPELSEAQTRWLEARPDRPWGWLEDQVYVVLLVGILLAIWIERATDPAGGRPRGRWIQVAAFAAYNVLIGGLAHRVTGLTSMGVFVLAFGAHFLVHDHGLIEERGNARFRRARWLLAGALLAGWSLVAVWRPPVVAIAAAVGLIAGGLILHIMKEEIHSARERRFPEFVGGALVYTALLLALHYSLGPAPA